LSAEKVDSARPETWRWVNAGTPKDPASRLLCHAAMSLKQFILMAEAIQVQKKGPRTFVQRAHSKVFQNNLEYAQDLADGAPVHTFQKDGRDYVLKLTPQGKK